MTALLCPFGYPDDFGDKSDIKYQEPVEISKGVCWSYDKCDNFICPFFAKTVHDKITLLQNTAEYSGYVNDEEYEFDENLDISIYNIMLDVYELADFEKNKKAKY